MRNVSDKSCRENENTHPTFNSFFFLFFYKNSALYKITWKNTVQPDRSQITIVHAHCIPKSTNTP